MLPWYARFYFWGVHGIFAEILFTGAWEFVVSGKWSLMGASSIWSFLTYGLGTFLIAEPLHELMVSYKLNILLRGLVGVALTYFWEFTMGAILSYFDACPWDYTDFDYDLLGLVTMEYAPAWFFAALYFEMIYGFMKNLDSVPTWKRAACSSSKQSDHFVLRLFNGWRSSDGAPGRH